MGSETTKHLTLTEEQRAKLIELLNPAEILGTRAAFDAEPSRLYEISINAKIAFEPHFLTYAPQLLDMLRSSLIAKIDKRIAKAEEILNGK